MQQYNFPTVIYFGEGSLEQLMESLTKSQIKNPLIVTDATLVQLGVYETLRALLEESKIKHSLFDQTHSNPLEEDVEKGTEIYKENHCDSIIALGGGSPMDVAKVIKIMSSHKAPLAQYDDAIGGDKLIVNPMPPLYAIPTTAGTGSEVGRCGVITMRETQRKTIFFAPELMPDIAVLEPKLTTGLPPHITAATGIDAFTHALEAYLAAGFHPMADGIALEAIKLCLDNLETAVRHGDNLEARANMQIAATMGATAFQKGLGMIHSLAHPLSAHFNIHHGLANALLLPDAIAFIEKSDLNKEQEQRIVNIFQLFAERDMEEESLAHACGSWFQELNITFGLSNHGIPESKLNFLASEAFADPCHSTNLIPVTEADLLEVYRAAL